MSLYEDLVTVSKFYKNDPLEEKKALTETIKSHGFKEMTEEETIKFLSKIKHAKPE